MHKKIISNDEFFYLSVPVNWCHPLGFLRPLCFDKVSDLLNKEQEKQIHIESPRASRAHIFPGMLLDHGAEY